MNSEISCSIGNMPTCGNSQIQNTLPRLGGQSIGQTLGLVMGALPAPITGEDAWRSTFATSIFCEKQAQIFCGTMRDGTTSGARGMGPSGAGRMITCASTG